MSKYSDSTQYQIDELAVGCRALLALVGMIREKTIEIEKRLAILEAATRAGK